MNGNVTDHSRARRLRLALCLAPILAACFGAQETRYGTALFVTVTVEDGLELDQVQVDGQLEDGTVFPPKKFPETPGARLSSGAGFRLLLPDSAGGHTLALRVRGLLGNALRAEQKAEVAVKKGTEVKVSVHLAVGIVPIDTDGGAPDGGDAGTGGTDGGTKLGLGSACTSTANCASGNCVDGVCCDTPASSCTGCKACNLAGSAGVCANVPATQDPHDACNQDAPGCKAANCDGSGGCAASDGTSCGAQSCSAQTQLNPVCQSGACVPQGTSCGSFDCAGTSCATSCTLGTDVGCKPGTFCVGGTTCQAKKALGDSCSGGNQCVSGNCVDSVCCDQPAANCGGCKACNVASSLGTCTHIPQGTDPHGACTADPAACLSDTCNGTGSCAAPNGTWCATASCTAGTRTDHSCQGGACTPAQTSCGAFACNGSACATGCSVGTDVGCAAGNYCAGGTVCLPRKGLGQSCGAGNECSLGNCVDNVCCDTPVSGCNGCRACDVAGSAGTCANVPNGSDPHSTCTASYSGCSQANCDGSGGCRAPDGSECGASSCSSSIQTDQVCTSGVCGPTQRSCGAFACNGNFCAVVCVPATNSGCPAGTYCVGGSACAPKLSLGTSCGADNQCASGNCVDFVCCDTAQASCNNCKACNVSGSLGVCTNVLAGDDPHNVCTASVPGCTTDSCDGAGTCRAADGAVCGSPTCSSSTETDRACSAGVCTSVPKSCAPFVCDTSTCFASCQVGTDVGCGAGKYCVGGTSCAAKLGQGSSCSSGNQCVSGNCVDFVCCDQSAATCSGCKACNVPGSEGTCTSVPQGQDPHNQCSAVVASCLANDCNGSGSCTAVNGTPCGSPTCSSGTQSNPVCQGGSCTPTPVSCSPYVCNPGNTTCLSSCAADGDCAAENFCQVGGTCVGKYGNGSACLGGNQCVSGNCVDGFCCNASSSTCNGCRACNVTGSVGTCTNVLAGQDPHNTCALNVSGCVAADCDGAGSCTATNGTACGAPTCSAGTQTNYACQGGSCTPSPFGCGTFVCNAGSNTCYTTCTVGTDVECAAGNFCQGGTACVGKYGNGSGCATGNQCASGNCVDSFCCNEAATTCNGCRACSVSGSVGTCTDVFAGQDPHSFCTQNIAGCIADNCNGSGACTAANGTQCGASSCNSAIETDQVCSSGVCGPSSFMCPGDFACNGNVCGTTCTPLTTTGCRSGYYCSGGGTCVLLKAFGQSCIGWYQCQSGNCVDSVCCDQSAATCSGCKACNLPGSEGTCTNVPPGNDPHNTCTLNAAACIAADCNGGGSCTAADGVLCSSPTCSSGTRTDWACQGGSCTDASVSCSPYVCASGAACFMNCGSDAACVSTHYCSGSACIPKKPLGASCAGNNQCESGSCVDNVCCDETAATCNGCRACNVTGNLGFCTSVASGQDPHNFCFADAPNCKGSNCDGVGGCSVPDGTTCIPTFCGAGVENVNECQGGACTPFAVPCSPYACRSDATACMASCSVDSHCAPGHYCAGTTCVLKKSNGDACVGANECQSNSCILATSGTKVCCDQVACGLCLACEVSGVGCSPQGAGQDLKNECPSDPANCNSGVCDGSGACKPEPATTICWGPSCANSACDGQCASAQESWRQCDGVAVGYCPAGSTSAPCPGELICASATTCKASCAASADCVQGFYCNAGVCTPRKLNGAGCANDAECVSNVCDFGGPRRCAECRNLLACGPSGVPNSLCSSAFQGSCSTSCVVNSNCTMGPNAGWGAACNTGRCYCGFDTDCNPRAKRCDVSGSCLCGMGAPCEVGKTCTDNTMTAVCKWATGQPCMQPSDCASNVCNSGVCG